MLVYSILITQTKYGQANADLRDVHNFVCTVEGFEHTNH